MPAAGRSESVPMQLRRPFRMGNGLQVLAQLIYQQYNGQHLGGGVGKNQRSGIGGQAGSDHGKTNTKIKNFGASWLTEKANACSFIRKIRAKKRIISVVAKKIRKRIPKFALGMSKMISDGHDAFISNTKNHNRHRQNQWR